MAYFHRRQDGIDRAGKVIADILIAIMFLVFSLVFFGTLRGLVAFVVIEALLLIVDHVISVEDDASGAVVR